MYLKTLSGLGAMRVSAHADEDEILPGLARLLLLVWCLGRPCRAAKDLAVGLITVAGVGEAGAGFA